MRRRKNLGSWFVLALGLGASFGFLGCGDDSEGGGANGYGGTGGNTGGAAGSGGAAGGGSGGTAGVAATLKRSSRSSTIAISDDDSRVVMVNPEDGSISVFNTELETLVSRTKTGGEPSSVVLSSDGKSAYVANRADATVVRMDGVDTETPSIGATVDVGSEPTGVALSPNGTRLFVAEFAESRVTVIDTANMTVATTVKVKNPFTLAVTNDLDAEDSDELLVVPEFYGEAQAGGEAKDDGRKGKVRVFALSDLAAETNPITFEPRDSGFGPNPGDPTVKVAPNQLGSIAIQGDRVYVPAIAASPQGPIKFNVNVHPVVYVGDLASREENLTNVGTTNLARAVKDAVGTDPMLFLADLTDIAFIGDGNVAYALSRGADVVQRLVYDPATGIQVGSQFNKQIDITNAPAGSVAGCKTPTGIATAHDAPRAFVNCWLGKNLGVVDLSSQALSKTIESVPASTDATEQAIARGRRFFFTGRGRWSDNGWSSCASCHPGGLSDNITWSFGAGPRQSTSLDGTYSHGPGNQKQRILNWTAIFEEIHDFERNTRDTSGGLGAITTSPSGQCGTLAEEIKDPATLPGGLAQPLKELQDRPENCTKDWDDVEAYIKTIRPPRGLRSLDPESVDRGAKLFGMPSGSENNAGCVACHGGAGWTASRRFWSPSSATNTALLTAPFVKPAAWPASLNPHTFQIAPQPASADAAGVQAPPQVACVLRSVGTFGIPGDTAATDLLEIRATGTRAQGAGGFNVPSLYGISLGAPYLHHGQAKTLEELFDDPKWQSHLLAANPVFLTTGDAAQQKKDLIAFLQSIDASTAEQALPSTWEGCPASFP
jgi:YVTN family beta-propeller protein